MDVDLDRLQIEVFRCHREGRYGDALALIDENADQAPSDATVKLAFWRACLLALAGARDEALGVLENAAEEGCWWHPQELADDDLSGLRDDSRFGELQQVSHRQFEAARSASLPRPLHLGPEEDRRRTMMGLHRAAGSPIRAASLWAPLAEDDWRVLLPAAPHQLNSADRLWLDPDRGELDLEAAANAVAPHVPPEAAPFVLGGFAHSAPPEGARCGPPSRTPSC